jgi:integral membrane sensor domain MASE1
MRKTSQVVQQWQESPPRFASAKYLLTLFLLFLAYCFTGAFGLHLASFHPSATPVWAPTGIALSAFLLLGRRIWPAIFLGALAINFPVSGVSISLVIAIGNTVEGLLGSYLVRRFAGGLRAFDHPETIFRFVIVAAVLSTIISPSLGVTSLAVGGYTEWSDYRLIWSIWWLGGAVGNVVVAPLILLSALGVHARWDCHKLTETVTVGLLFVLTGMVTLGSIPYFEAYNYPLQFLYIPFLLWTALRFGQIEAASAVAILSTISIAGTLQQYGAFAGDEPSGSLVLQQAFVGVVGVMTHIVASMVVERKRVE